MRFGLPLIGAVLSAVAWPALAWDFTPRPICTVTHETDSVAVRITFDSRTGLYAMDLTRSDAWQPAPSFAIRFDGPMPRTIVTDRQTYSEDGRTLTVTDTGFGNVLSGIEFSQMAVVMLGPFLDTLPTIGAAPSIQKFRACEASILS